MSGRKGKGASRRRIWLSIPKWQASFDAVIAENDDAALVLNNWGFRGLSDGLLGVDGS
jgi:hypothetical protein